MNAATILGTPPEEALAGAFARLVRKLHLRAGGRAEDAEAVALAASLVSRAASDGQSSLDVGSIEAQEFLRTINYFPSSGPPLETWLEQLARSPVVARSGNPNGFRPLVLVGETRLYLYRYFDYERRLAARLAEMNRPAALPCPAPVAAALLSRLFPQEGGGRPDWQKIAAATALLRRLCIVSGGPGTGKTTTVIKVLALLLALHPALRVALAAPTGKAAARLQGTLRDQLAGLPVAAEVKARLPAEGYTVHRLLGHRPGRVSFRHDREHPLPFDLVVVDEASMLDLALATKLVEALPDKGRLILLGDKDQLSAVETGTVFANLSATRGMGAEVRESVEALTDETLPESDVGGAEGLSDAVVWLEQGHRYAQGGAIGALVERIREGDADAVLAWLAGRSGGEVGSEVLWQDTVPGAEPLAATLIEGYAEYLDAVQSGAPPEVVLAAFERRRVLCAVREGEQGTARLNALLTEQLPRATRRAALRRLLVRRAPGLDHGQRLHGARLQRRCGRGAAGAGRPFPRPFPAPRWRHPAARPQPPSRARDRLRHDHPQGPRLRIRARRGGPAPPRQPRPDPRAALHRAYASARLGAPVGQARGAPRHDHPKIAESAVGSLRGVRPVRPVLSEHAFVFLIPRFDREDPVPRGGRRMH